MVASGVVGSPRSVSVRFFVRMPDGSKANSTRYSRGLAGGATLDLGVYSMSVLTAVMGGEMPTVRRSAATRWAVDPQIDEAMVGEVSFARGGVNGSFEYSFLSGPQV